MKTVLAREPGSRFTLIYGNRSLKSTMFKEEIEDLKDRYMTRLVLHHVFSDEHTDAPLNMGVMNRDKIGEFLRTVVPAARVDHVFVCGPFQMNDEACPRAAASLAEGPRTTAPASSRPCLPTSSRSGSGSKPIGYAGWRSPRRTSRTSARSCSRNIERASMTRRISPRSCG
jgi:hypothetical protein